MRKVFAALVSEYEQQTSKNATVSPFLFLKINKCEMIKIRFSDFVVNTTSQLLVLYFELLYRSKFSPEIFDLYRTKLTN